MQQEESLRKELLAEVESIAPVVAEHAAKPRRPITPERHHIEIGGIVATKPNVSSD
jgi:hypothetical protein